MFKFILTSAIVISTFFSLTNPAFAQYSGGAISGGAVLGESTTNGIPTFLLFWLIILILVIIAIYLSYKKYSKK